MSFNTNMSSGYTDSLNQRSVCCAKANTLPNPCCLKASGPLTCQLPSMILLSRKCPKPTPEQFAKYPKVAVPSSILTESKVAPANCSNRTNRFSQYQRYQAPIPCQPLPQSANMAGISQPSTRQCEP